MVLPNLLEKKMAPILGYIEEKGDKKGQVQYMGESLDIVKFVDEREGSPLLKPETKRADLATWQAPLDKAASSLIKPRSIKTFKEDFATNADQDYFTKKYNLDFDELLSKSDEFIKVINGGLKSLEALIKGDKTLNEGGLSYDDILYLPFLRNLTLVKGINWPAKVKEYVEFNCAKGGLKVYFNQAI